jgi:hypothetical protein
VHLVIPEVLVQQVERPMDPTVLQLILLTLMAERKQVVVHLLAVVILELQVLWVRVVMDKMVHLVVVPMLLVGAAAAAVDTTAVAVVETVAVVPVVEVDLHML